MNLHTFEVQQPRAIGKRFVLYQLMSRQPLVFDEETRRQLLMEQLQCWEAPLVERLGAHLPHKVCSPPCLDRFEAKQFPRRVGSDNAGSTTICLAVGCSGWCMAQPGEVDSAPARAAADQPNAVAGPHLPGGARLVRFLAEIDSGDQVTLELRGSGQFLGWVSLLRAEACETVIASEETLVLALPAQGFLAGLSANQDFADWFGTKAHSHEAFCVARAALAQQPQRPSNWVELLMEQWPKSLVVSIRPGEPFQPPAQAPPHYAWYLSTAQLPEVAVGQSLQAGDVLPQRSGFGLNYRCVGLPRFDAVQDQAEQLPPGLADSAEPLESPLPAVSLQQLGILEDDNLEDDQRFPLVRGKGTLQEALAVCEMRFSSRCLSAVMAFRKFWKTSFGETKLSVSSCWQP